MTTHGGLYEIGDDELRAFVNLYDIGEVLAWQRHRRRGENSNFLLTHRTCNFILTLYEKGVAPADLPFFIALMDLLRIRASPARPRCGRAMARHCASCAGARRRLSPF